VRACRIAGLSRAAYYAPPQDRLERDGPCRGADRGRRRAPELGLLEVLRPAAPRWHGVEREAGLPRVPRAAAQPAAPGEARVPEARLQPLLAPAALNATWAVDFMSDTLYDGRRFRTLNVLDEGNREALAVEVATSIPGATSSRTRPARRDPRRAARDRCDNGPELISEALRDWAERHGVALHHIQPGKPNQNAYIERFNRTYQREVLDAYLFASLADVRVQTEAWLTTYNTERPHDSLGEVPPLTYCPGPPPPTSPASNCPLDGGAYAPARTARDEFRDAAGELPSCRTTHRGPGRA
jgi:putative transposase